MKRNSIQTGSSSVNRNILRLAVPNIVSNIVIPMLGMIDTAIAGHIGADVNIAALAIGATIFNFIYWNCAFVRMGTSGMTAQAFGAGNMRECANMLLRSLWLALAIVVLLLTLQQPVGRFSLYIMHGSETVSRLAGEYFFARIWAVPASIALFAVHGWFIGMQDAKTPMIVSIISVITNALFSLVFVYCFDMGIKGIAWGTVVAQYVGLVMSVALWLRKYRHLLGFFDIRESLKLRPLLQFMNVNKDVFLRTFCVVIVYTFFTSISARFGDTVLATNALLMQLFTLFS
ncbi:MAG: MATE family efflux transporter, partial [Tannerella sp.]|nr:MATE family efflux transporter [Tannerella sp.]